MSFLVPVHHSDIVTGNRFRWVWEGNAIIDVSDDKNQLQRDIKKEEEVT